MDDYVGKTLGSYEIIEWVGAGGMATVYRARQESINRDVAVKVMSKDVSQDDLFVQRFKNEAQLIAQLEHPHILPVHDFGEQDGTLYIVMRFLSTGTLEDHIQHEVGMPLDETVKMFLQLARALDYAHEHGIVHRDLKPANVLVDSQQNVFLTDFGIAKSLESDVSLTATDSVVGTPTYMSPEQSLGEPIDRRADVYALGVILFEMLTGRQLFTASNTMAMMLQHVNDAPPSPTDYNPDIPPGVEAVILRALEKDASNRYQTAQKMADALERAYQGTADAPPLETSPMEKIPLNTTPLEPVPSDEGTMAGIPAEDQTAVATPEPTKAGTFTVPFEYNAITTRLREYADLARWGQAAAVSIFTFIALAQLTQGALLEVGLLSLFPGLVVYGLLHQPTVGALLSFVLILVPLLAHAPGLALIWLAVVIVAGTRLNSREIMLTLVTTVLATTPVGFVVPLLGSWWFRARRVALPSALGVTLAIFFAASLGWPDANGLLSTPADGPFIETEVELVGPEDEILTSGILMSDFDTSYIGLFDAQVWEVWSEEPERILQTTRATVQLFGDFLIETRGAPLVIGAVWALAAVVTVSNRRAKQPVLRASGIGLALGILLLAHGLAPNTVLTPLGVGLALLSGGLAYALSQAPIQVDPNEGNKIGTMLRMLRQSLGAVFMALGIGAIAVFLGEQEGLQIVIAGITLDLFAIFCALGVFGTIAMVTNPLVGATMVFTGVVAALASVRPVAAGVIGVLFVLYLIVSFFLDRRQPRGWNPQGAGMLIGAPGLANTALYPLAVMSTGALESQLPATILATASHVTLFAISDGVEPTSAIIQIGATIAGVLTTERLMASDLLKPMANKRRRLIFTAVLALVLAIVYFVPGGMSIDLPLPLAILLSVVTGAALVLAMGERAAYWRRFIEQIEDEEDLFEDEELTSDGLLGG